MKKILNNKGSAMILVLSSLIILMMICSVVAMLSTANIAMSQKYSNWSSEYYSLDYAAQDQLVTLDETVFIAGENIARYYLQSSYYKYDSVGAFPSGTGMPAVINMVFLGADSLQTLIHAEWNDIYSDYLADPVNSEDEFNTRMQLYVSEVFKVLYYCYIDGNLSNTTADYDAGAITASTELTNLNWFPSFDTYSDFNDFCSHVTESPKITITAVENALHGKSVDVRITVIPPSFSAVQQTKYYMFRANPLYANALSVQGSITFTGSGTTSITGDVVSNNQTSGGSTLGLDEGNTFGIKTASGSAARVTIKGNVYSAGDLHLFGIGSTINVERYPLNFSSTLELKKNYLYNIGNENEYFFNTSVSAVGDDISPYSEGTSVSGNVSYIYKDNGGGNVYCNNLAIEENTENAFISVSDEVWTQDDIQNDGKADTHIIVSGNYIGLISTSDENGNPNGSSAVINNARLYSNAYIELKGDCIIPGTVFYKLEGEEYYQTAESVTAQGGEFFDTYLYSPDISLSTATYTINGTEYLMYDQSTFTPENWISAFITTILNKSLNSEVRINPTNWYSLGVMIGSGTSYYDSGNRGDNLMDYSIVKSGILPTVFAMKTKTYGTDGASFSNLTDLSYGINDSAHDFYYFPGDATFDVSGVINSGIIYCNGNLTLTGSGTFTGSIICAGNLTINAGVNIYYDEAVIRDVLGLKPDYTPDFESGSRTARQFFSPSGFTDGNAFGIEEITILSTSAGERDSDGVQRYKINSWKEIS